MKFSLKKAKNYEIRQKPMYKMGAFDYEGGGWRGGRVHDSILQDRVKLSQIKVRGTGHTGCESDGRL